MQVVILIVPNRVVKVIGHECCPDVIFLRDSNQICEQMIFKALRATAAKHCTSPNVGRGMVQFLLKIADI